VIAAFVVVYMVCLNTRGPDVGHVVDTSAS